MGLIVDEPPGMNARKTDVMIAAAAVTTTEDALKPLMIAPFGSPVTTYSSRMAETRNIS